MDYSPCNMYQHAYIAPDVQLGKRRYMSSTSYPSCSYTRLSAHRPTCPDLYAPILSVRPLVTFVVSGAASIRITTA